MVEDRIRTTTRPPLMPADTPDYAAPAWASCMQWAIGNDDIRAAFDADTGNHYEAPKTALDRMVDDATGHGSAYIKAFVEWANEHVWGRYD